MTLLIISPDYLSHYNPLSVLGTATAAAGDRVVVATGEGLRDRVLEDGFGWEPLALGPASNQGITTVDPAIQRFLEATKNGPLATIAHQATERERDLLWQPERVTVDIDTLLESVNPSQVIVDHVSFGSTLALYASGRAFGTLVPGHPTQLPVGDERYGIPPEWPTALRPSDEALAAVEAIADRVTTAFTERWNSALAAIGSDRPPVDDALRVHGDYVLYNSVASLQAPNRQERLPPNHEFVGPLVQDTATNELGSCLERWSSRPLVYVALGTFLSARSDVLARVANGLRRLDVRGAIAMGSTPLERLGRLPDDWLIAPTLPQPALLARADVAIHHGGNNSVQESLAAGARQIVMPFSTDQFANAADLEQRANATVLAPNSTSSFDIAAAVCAALTAQAPEPIPARQPTALLEAING